MPFRECKLYGELSTSVRFSYIHSLKHTAPEYGFCLLTPSLKLKLHTTYDNIFKLRALEITYKSEWYRKIWDSVTTKTWIEKCRKSKPHSSASDTIIKNLPHNCALTKNWFWDLMWRREIWLVRQFAPFTPLCHFETPLRPFLLSVLVLWYIYFCVC